jgi:hypothetical protein
MSPEPTLVSRKTLLAGVIYFNHRQLSANCIVRELWDEGAILSCADTHAIPVNNIELYIPSKNAYLPASIKDRAPGDLRVSFGAADHSPVAAGGGLTEVLRRLDQLELEVRKLRQMLNEAKPQQRTDEDGCAAATLSPPPRASARHLLKPSDRFRSVP